MVVGEMMAVFALLVFVIGMCVVVRDALYHAKHGTLDKLSDEDSTD